MVVEIACCVGLGLRLHLVGFGVVSCIVQLIHRSPVNNGPLEGQAGLAIDLVKSCTCDQDVWDSGYSNLQANIAVVLGILFVRVQKDSYVMEGKTAEYFN